MESLDESTNSAGKMALWKWIILLVFGSILAFIPYAVFMTPLSMDEMPSWLKCIIFAVGAVCAAGAYFLFEKWYKHWDKRAASSKIMPVAMPKEIAKGMLTGIGYFCVVVLVMALLGSYHILSYQFNWTLLICNLSMFLLVAVAEECIGRGVIFRLIDDRWGYVSALVISSLIFGLMHLGNDNATLWGCIAIAIEAGLLLGAAYKMSGTLWLPIGIHWLWNFTQGDVWGFAVSGTTGISSSIITPEVTGNELITGGAFGAEASIISVILGFSISCWMIYKYQVKNKAK